VLTACLLLAACAGGPRPLPEGAPLAYRVEAGGEATLAARLAPVFMIERPEVSYNRIGTVQARLNEAGAEEVFVDPSQATIYTEQRTFQTAHGDYSNLIYRVHFERVPFSLAPFYIGTGRNVGLFTIVTLDAELRPLLYTTVHTCGCYIAFVPTSLLPETAYPPAWQTGRQQVFGEDLPGRLDFSAQPLDAAVVTIHIRHGSHRVRDIALAPISEVSLYRMIGADVQPLAALENLPLGAATTSFYETLGPRAGYVKGSHKPWERLLMSWWTFDWRIGEDKKLGRDTGDARVFYTSIKPWQREASDLRDFAAFLRYWGWGL
jgi:hypothetical protein